MSRPARRRGVRAVALLPLAASLAGCPALDLRELREPHRPVRAEDARRVVDGDPARGRALVAEHGCTACHAFPGRRGPTAHVGPPLERFALRTNIGGSLPNRPEQLVRFVMDAPREIPGTGMPDLDVDEPDARHIAAYLYTLR
jgi:cytochrome c2